MSILIHDMVMPQNCDDCPLSHQGWSYLEYHCPFDPAENDSGYSIPRTNVLFSATRQPWCPLIEVEDNK